MLVSLGFIPQEWYGEFPAIPYFYYTYVFFIDLTRQHLHVCIGRLFLVEQLVCDKTKVCFYLWTSISSVVICMNETSTNNTWHLVNASKMDCPCWKVQIVSENAGGWRVGGCCTWFRWELCQRQRGRVSVFEGVTQLGSEKVLLFITSTHMSTYLLRLPGSTLFPGIVMSVSDPILRSLTPKI